jgi:hypothetical protein
MNAMTRGVRQKVIAAAAVAALVAGGALAAVSATGQSGDAKRGARHGNAARARSRDLTTAATYLGLSTAELSRQLRGGKTLAQIAASSGGGRSAQGLIEVLEAARRAKLAKVAANLPKRISAEVQRPGGPGAHRGRPRLSARTRLHALFTRHRRLGDAIAAYLSSTPAQVERQLASGKTLAQLAAATPGKSAAGLVTALVAAQRRIPAVAAAQAHRSAAQRAAHEERLQRRAARLTQRRFAGPAALG